MVLALAVAVLTGLAAGAVNSFLIAVVGIPPILATLGTMQLFTGIAIVITKGYAVVGYPEAFLAIGSRSVWIFPIPFLVLRGLRRGGERAALPDPVRRQPLRHPAPNLKAAVFAGIETRKELFKSYLATGLLSGIAGVVMISRTNSAKADYGESYVLQAVLVSVLGGVNPAGGFGTVMGVTIAVLSLQFLSSGFNMLRFSNFAKEFTWGMFLLAIMTLNYVQNRPQAQAQGNRGRNRGSLEVRNEEVPQQAGRSSSTRCWRGSWRPTRTSGRAPPATCAAS